MKFGAMNFPITPLVKEIEELGRLGFDYVEISMDPPEATPKRIGMLENEIAGILSQSNMGTVAHMPTFVSMADLCERIRRASVEETVEALKTASRLGMEKVVLHPPVVSGLGKFVPKKAREYGFLSLREILQRAQDLNMAICLENMFHKTSSFTIPEEFETALEEFPNVGLTLDIGHAFLAGGVNNILEFIHILGNRIHHLHVNDNFGREDNHLPVGTGSIDFRRVLRALRASGYDDTMTVEVFSSDRDYLRLSREKLKNLWEEVL